MTIGAINIHFRPVPFVLSLIYLRIISPNSYIGFLIPTVGLMNNNRINFFIRGGLGGAIESKNYGSSGYPTLYIDIGMGYNFNVNTKK